MAKHATYHPTPDLTPFGLANFIVKTTANNGEVLEVGKGYSIQTFTVDDVDLQLPDSAGGAVGIGESLWLNIGTNLNVARALIDQQGSDILFGLGLIGGLNTRAAFQGDGHRMIQATFLGSALGAPSWMFTELGADYRTGWRVTAEVATDGPLPAFTPSGVYPDQILTMDANGLLTIDGVVPAQTLFGGVVVAGESGTNRRHHGIYDVLVPGDGSTQAVLRRRSDWALAPQVFAGTSVAVEKGTKNAGNIYISPAGINPFLSPDDFDWVINVRDVTDAGLNKLLFNLSGELLFDVNGDLLTLC